MQTLKNKLLKAMPIKKTDAKGKPKDEDEAYKCTSSKGKPVKEKDPNAPKRPTTAYFAFMNERRVTLKKEKPGLSLGDTTKTMTDEWNKMSDKEKKKYTDIAQKDKDRYEKEMEDAGLRKKGGKEDGGVKKSQSSYMWFC